MFRTLNPAAVKACAILSMERLVRRRPGNKMTSSETLTPPSTSPLPSEWERRGNRLRAIIIFGCLTGCVSSLPNDCFEESSSCASKIVDEIAMVRIKIFQNIYSEITHAFHFANLLANEVID